MDKQILTACVSCGGQVRGDMARPTRSFTLKNTVRSDLASLVVVATFRNPYIQNGKDSIPSFFP